MERKKRREEELRKKQQEAEDALCPFKPMLKDSVKIDFRRPVAVKGLGNFLRNHDRALEKKRLQVEQEKKVFLLDVGKRSTRKLTIPQPFRFSSSLRERRKSCE